MNLEAQPWITDFRIAAALDSFRFLGFWVSGGVSHWFVFDVLCVLGSGFGVFLLVSSFLPPPLSAGASLGCSGQSSFSIVAQDTFSEVFLGRVWSGSWVFVLPAPPAQCRAVVWIIGPLNCGTRLSVFCVIFFFVLPIPAPLAPGAIWVFWLLRL